MNVNRIQMPTNLWITNPSIYLIIPDLYKWSEIEAQDRSSSGKARKHPLLPDNLNLRKHRYPLAVCDGQPLTVLFL